MNNKLALEKLSSLVDNEESRLIEYKNVLRAAEILPEGLCKIAVLGTRSQGKSLLINLLSKDNIASCPTISVPIYIGPKQTTDLHSPHSAFCINNNVEIIAKHSPFYWTETGSHVLPGKQPLDQYLKNASGASGIFAEFANTGHEVAQKASLILAPDLLAIRDAECEKQNLNAADIADIVLIVATPSEINSNLYDFLFSHTGILDNKIVLVFIIHDEISNFYHYPLQEKCAEAIDLEKKNEDSAKGAYETISKSYTTPDMAAMLKTGITKDTQTLIQRIEELIKKNYKKANLQHAYFLPTGEIPPQQKPVVEDQKIITDVKNWQLQRIYSEVAQTVTSVGTGKLPAIAWEYLFRKCEDICFDTLTPICQKLEIECVSDYAKLNVLNSLIAVQSKEVNVLLRDYSCNLEEEELKKRFCNLREKALGILPQTKDHQKKCKQAILEFVKSLPYSRLFGRVKQQYGFELPSIEQITEEALNSSMGKDDASHFVKCIVEKTSLDQIIANWKKLSPLEIEKNTILREHNQMTAGLKKDILDALEAWISIADLVHCKDKIAFIVQKREEIRSFSPEKVFSPKL